MFLLFTAEIRGNLMLLLIMLKTSRNCRVTIFLITFFTSCLYGCNSGSTSIIKFYDNKEITAYSLNKQIGSITDHKISVTMPFGTNVTNLVATYSTTGKNVTINSNPQVSSIYYDFHATLCNNTDSDEYLWLDSLSQDSNHYDHRLNVFDTHGKIILSHTCTETRTINNDLRTEYTYELRTKDLISLFSGDLTVDYTSIKNNFVSQDAFLTFNLESNKTYGPTFESIGQPPYGSVVQTLSVFN